MERKRLPIDDVLPDIVASLKECPNLVVIAPPGAGKTTGIGPALIKAGLVKRNMVMLQPRRVAARATTQRIALDQGWVVGEEVGFQVRFQKELNRRTKLQVVTEGILTRRLQEDPFLEDTDLVMLDEFHLRSIHGDLALAFLREIQQTVRPDLKIIVASATLAGNEVGEFLGNCPVIESEGRLFPLAIKYEKTLRATSTVSLEERVSQRVLRAKRENEGHVLVFLPGVREIKKMQELLEEMSNCPTLPLHGSLSSEEQDRAINPSEPSIILATNLAETSLTIEGVRAVVDSGLERIPIFSPATGLTTLHEKRISKDSAKQRAGRAGRTAPGVVYRLWTESEQRGLLTTTPPEVRRISLCRTVLELYVWGTKPRTFNWFERPDDSVIDEATKLLHLLGALKGDEVTAVGRELLKLPLHPRLGLMMLTAKEEGVTEDGAIIASLLNEPDIIDWQKMVEDHTPHSSDVLFRLGLLEGNARCLRSSKVKAVRQGANEITSLVDPRKRTARRQVSETTLLKLLLKAYPDRVARRRCANSDRALMVGGHGLKLWSKSRVKKGEFFLAIELAGNGKESLVRQASLIDKTMLDYEVKTETIFIKVDKKIQTLERKMYDTLCVEEKVVQLDDDEACRLLAREAAREMDSIFLKEEDTREFIERVLCLRQWLPELALPDFSRPSLKKLLPEICHSLNSYSFSALSKFPFLEFLKGKMSYEQRSAVDEFAPEKLTVPSGAKIKVSYERGGPPVLRVQLQNLFGLADTPKIARGRVAVLLHLLAPNGRPTQVTDDLRSFWNETYPQVRKELRGRYAKHAWPEDPWNAQPESRPKRRKR